ncbi:hypothetical protein [Pararhodobacter zhoushanensis]|uniref:Uncharacterized protein n=1 Tax=Pararhodobacter zhoushanensis TaxID=2479545 RepID=A0ABT3H4E7_9RHOB|nr:hypothetical protein [Pararhodobacter zhoushanensis]MCW1934691.1 hypothetical protein [Pararhodobacter zhoushanensis]
MLDGLTISASTERICADPEGRQAMATLRNRVLGSDWRVAVVAGVAGAQAAHLPGRVIVLGEALIARLDSPEALAGWMVAEAQARATSDPLLDVLDYAGTRATLALLTTGELPEGSVRDYARRRIARTPALPDAEALGSWLDGIGISSTPYALSLPADRSALSQALADRPMVERIPSPLLSDGEWLTLQAICAN